MRVIDEVSGAIFEQEITADLPAATQFLSPRLLLNNCAAAAAVAHDCAGAYLETYFRAERFAYRPENDAALGPSHEGRGRKRIAAQLG